MYKRILLAIDDDDASRRALKEAARLTKSTGAVLKVLHVVCESIEDASYAPSIYYSKVTAAQRRAGEEVLTDAGEALRLEGVECERQLSEVIGISEAQEIVRQAQGWPADLIVMGTHGRRGLSRLLMGSNAETVLRTSSAPVLLVRNQFIDAKQPSVSTAGSYGRVLVAVDGSEPSLKGLVLALDYAQSVGAQVKAVYVLNILIPDGSAAPSICYEPLLLKLRREAAEVIASVKGRGAARDMTIEAETVETVGGRTADAILDAAKGWHADVIVMGTHGRRGMRRVTVGSDAEDVVRASTVPVLLTRQDGEVDTAPREPVFSAAPTAFGSPRR
jgi:nucleotide-binding universal stress UspA family protein